MPKYQKIPVIVDAFQAGVDQAPDWFIDKVCSGEIVIHATWEFGWCEIKTLEGVMRGNRGDYIIRGIKGEIYPCKADIFVKTYELAEGAR